MSKFVAVAIDGPAGSGKSTVAKKLATELGFVLVDTGAIYRTVAFAAREQNVNYRRDEEITALIDRLDISFRFENGVNRVLLAGRDVSSDIRTEEISQEASLLSAQPAVRRALLNMQRRLAEQANSVIEGRDIGTVVLPDAAVKFFLDAALEERARRRFEELRARGCSTSYEQTLAALKQRDEQDTSREVAPLKRADDAVVVDSTAMSVEQVLEYMVTEVRRAAAG